MIRFAEKRDMEEIVEIWQESFQDSKEEIEDFFSQCKESVRVCVYEEDHRVGGFLCLIAATLNLMEASPEKEEGMKKRMLHYPSEYIYAVATHKKLRNHGICTRLLEYVRTVLSTENKCGILVPADEDLEEFYKKRGFFTCFQKVSIQVNIKESIKEKGKENTKGNMDMVIPEIRSITTGDYLILREKALQRISHLELTKEVLQYAILSCLQEGACLRSVLVNGKEYGFIYHQKMDDAETIYIQEITAVTREEIHLASLALLCALGKNRAKVCVSYSTYGLLLPKGYPYDGCMNLVID